MKVGQVGVRITLNLKTDITGASNVRIRYRTPDGTVGTWNADIDTTGEKIQYITQAGDIDQAGEWKFEPDLTLDGFSGPVDGEGTLYVSAGLSA